MLLTLIADTPPTAVPEISCDVIPAAAFDKDVDVVPQQFQPTEFKPWADTTSAGTSIRQPP
jgi:hypothetical protein